jgi:hypothetical protein
MAGIVWFEIAADEIILRVVVRVENGQTACADGVLAYGYGWE